jgi:hypothetical protein
MKFVKFSMLALTLGLFIASCGGGESTETVNEDTITVPVIEEPVAPVLPDTTAPVIDTTTVVPAP